MSQTFITRYKEIKQIIITQGYFLLAIDINILECFSCIQSLLYDGHMSMCMTLFDFYQAHEKTFLITLILINVPLRGHAKIQERGSLFEVVL